MSAFAGKFATIARANSELLSEHLMRLRPEDRRNRFCGAVSDSLLSRYANERKPIRTIGYVVDGKLRAAGELLWMHNDSAQRSAEIALSVENEYQGQGLGTELLHRLILIARNRPLDNVTLMSLAENYKLRRLVAKFDAKVSASRGAILAHIDTPARTVSSLVLELRLRRATIQRHTHMNSAG